LITDGSANANKKFDGFSPISLEAKDYYLIFHIRNTTDSVSGDGERIQQYFKQLNDSAKTPVSGMRALGKESDGLKSKLAQARESILSVNTALKGVMAATAIGSIAAVGTAIFNTGLSAVKASSQMKQYEVAFSTMLKSQEKGRAMLADLQNFAVETPFDVQGVVSTSQKLMAFGVEADKVVDTMRILGDATAAFGGNTELLDRMGYALGQMRVSGRLNAQDMNQLANAGIPAWEMLAEAAGKSVAEVRKASEQGLIDGQMAADVIMAGMQDRYSGAMEAMSQEVGGLWSSIVESGQIALATVGDYLVDTFDIKGILNEVSEVVGGVSKALMEAREQGKSFSEAIREAVPAPVIIAVGALAAVIAGGLVAACVAGVAALAGLVAPVAPFVAGMAAVGAAIAALYAYWDDLSAVASDAWQAIEEATAEAVAMLAEMLVAMAAGGIATVLKLGEGIISIIGGALDEAGGYCPDFLKTFQTMLSDAFDAVCSWADNCIAEIKRVLAAQDEVKAAVATTPAGNSSGDDEKEKKSGSNWFSDVTERFRSSFGRTGGSTKRSGGSRKSTDDDMKRKEQEVNRITEALGRAQEATRQLTESFDDLKVDINFAGMSGSDAVYEEIERERNQRIKAIDDVLAKQKQAITDAEKLRDSATKTGNAKKLQLDTQLNAARAEMDAALNAATHEEFLAYLESEKLAKYEALMEEQELRQQLLEWRLSQGDIAEQMTDLWIDYGRNVASSIGQAVGSIVDGSKSVGQAMREVLNSIINNIVTTAAEFAAVCAMLSMYGVNPPGPIAAKMMFGIGVTHQYEAGSKGAKLAGQKFASGGIIYGPGTSTSDSIPAMLSNGEYVVRAAAVRKIGLPTLNAINAGRGFADGGIVSASAFVGKSQAPA
ncbi:MAG: tape measure protein, partial [Selenomonadales bacterium]|nr:tape measure protein [Selenomonadales bacterium]